MAFETSMTAVPASVAQLDARPTVDQEVTGSITFFRGDYQEIVSTIISFLPLTEVSGEAKECAWLTACPVKI